MTDTRDEVARLQEVVTEAWNYQLLAGGPVHRDAALLDLCATALQHLTRAEKALVAVRAAQEVAAAHWQSNGHRSPALDADSDRLWAARTDHISKAKPLLRRIAKLPATTGAGIYAKALVVRSSITGAPVLAKSLAADLIACRELRATLWPATAAETQT